MRFIIHSAAFAAIIMLMSCSAERKEYPREFVKSLVFLNNNKEVDRAEICDSSADVAVICVKLNSCSAYIEITPLPGSYHYDIRRDESLLSGYSHNLNDILSKSRDYCDV